MGPEPFALGMESLSETIVAGHHVLSETLQADHLAGDVVPILHEFGRRVRSDLVLLLVSAAQRLVQAEELVRMLIVIYGKTLRPHPHDEHLLHRGVSQVADHSPVLSQRPLCLVERFVVECIPRVLHYKPHDLVILRTLDQELAAQAGVVSASGP